MRISNDLTYQEYKEEMAGAFCQFEKYGATPAQVTNFLTHEDWDSEMEGTTSAYLWYLAIAVRELELDILEDRVLAQISFHIPFYDQGDYHDLDPKEKELVDADVTFVKSKVSLIPRDQLEAAEEKEDGQK